MNIIGLDHLVILCADIEAGAHDYEVMLGRSLDWAHHNSSDGTRSALFRLGNTAIELLAPAGDGPVGDRIRQLLAASEQRLTSLAFRVDDIAEAHRIAARRGLFPQDITQASSDYDGRSRSWSRFRCKDDALSGLKVFMLQETNRVPADNPPTDDAAFRLDHLVVNTSNPDRAMACYGAKLGLRLALDRTNADWGARFLFFRLPDLTFEVVQRLDSDKTPEDPDTLWGLTWQVRDIDAAHRRLKEHGVDVSEVRKGRKPGTRVMSIKSHDLGVPTLFLEANAVSS